MDQIVSLIKLIGKGRKIFRFQNPADVRLLVQQRNFRLTETMAFFAVNVSLIQTVRTVVDGLQVVCREAGSHKKACFAFGQVSEKEPEFMKRRFIPL